MSEEECRIMVLLADILHSSRHWGYGSWLLAHDVGTGGSPTSLGVIALGGEGAACAFICSDCRLPRLVAQMAGVFLYYL